MLILSTGQGKVRPHKVTVSKNDISHVTHVLWVVCDVEHNGKVILLFHLKVKKSLLVRQILKIKILNTKHASDAVLAPYSNEVFGFGI